MLAIPKLRLLAGRDEPHTSHISATNPGTTHRPRPRSSSSLGARGLPLLPLLCPPSTLNRSNSTHTLLILCCLCCSWCFWELGAGSAGSWRGANEVGIRPSISAAQQVGSWPWRYLVRFWLISSWAVVLVGASFCFPLWLFSFGVFFRVAGKGNRLPHFNII